MGQGQNQDPPTLLLLPLRHKIDGPWAEELSPADRYSKMKIIYAWHLRHSQLRLQPSSQSPLKPPYHIPCSSVKIGRAHV